MVPAELKKSVKTISYDLQGRVVPSVKQNAAAIRILFDGIQKPQCQVKSKAFNK